jgi:hypothetical protein
MVDCKVGLMFCFVMLPVFCSHGKVSAGLTAWVASCAVHFLPCAQGSPRRPVGRGLEGYSPEKRSLGQKYCRRGRGRIGPGREEQREST